MGLSARVSNGNNSFDIADLKVIKVRGIMGYLLCLFRHSVANEPCCRLTAVRTYCLENYNRLERSESIEAKFDPSESRLCET